MRAQPLLGSSKKFIAFRRPSAKKASAKKTPGHLSIETKPWVWIFVDGKRLGQTPIFKHEVPAGRRRIRFFNEAEGIDVTVRRTVASGATLKLKRIPKR